VLIVGLSHKTTELALREKFSVSKAQVPALLQELRDSGVVAEALCLSTCNRMELLLRPESVSLDTPHLGAGSEAVSLASQAARKLLRKLSGLPSVDAFAYEHTGVDAIRHLLRVATSLDSLVVGEPQILGQLKESFELASQGGYVGSQLGRCITHAFHVAKRVRNETTIGEGSISVSSVALELARGVFGSLKQSSVLLVGAGEMAEAAARALGKDAAGIRVCNRSLERAAELAAKFHGTASTLESLEQELTLADVVITSTAATHYIVTRDLVQRVMKARKGRTLLFVDIAVPRNVDPEVHRVNNVFAFNVDDLQQQTQATAVAREKAVSQAEQIIETELEDFLRWTKGLRVQPILLALRARTKAILSSELDRTLAGKLAHLPDADKAVLLKMMESATNKLLHAPTTRLKQSAETEEGQHMARMAEQLFDVPSEAADPRQSAQLKTMAALMDPHDPSKTTLQ
jgi:glutamyl-tRNA reductase